MPSYAYLCKKAGLPAPTGLAKIDRSQSEPGRDAHEHGNKPIQMTVDAINHTALTLMACCKANQPLGHNLETAILHYLAALRDRIT